MAKFETPTMPLIGYDVELLQLLIRESALVAVRATEMLDRGVPGHQGIGSMSTPGALSVQIGLVLSLCQRLERRGLIDPAIVQEAHARSNENTEFKNPKLIDKQHPSGIFEIKD